jgi:excisionase family DNA binding protein
MISKEFSIFYLSTRSKTRFMQEEKLLKVPEVARRLRVGEETVRRWIAEGLIEVIILPRNGSKRQYRIRQSALDRLMSQGQPVEE